MSERRLIHLSLVVAWLLSSASIARAQDALPTCDSTGKCCTSWTIDLFPTTGARPWGQIDEPTLDRVQSELKRRQSFDRQWCASLGRSEPCSAMNYDKPGRPRCTNEGASTDSGDPCGSLFAKRVENLAREIEPRTASLAKSSSAFAALGAGVKFVDGKPNPYATAGDVLSSYADALAHARERLQRLRTTMQADCAPSHPTDAVDALWPHAGGAAGYYVDHAQAALDKLEMWQELEDLERAVRSIPERDAPRLYVPTVPHLSEVRSIHRNGQGELLMGNTILQPGVRVSRGSSTALGYVYDDGSGTLRIGKATLRPGAKPGELRIVGTGGGTSETIETRILADRDGDNVSDAADRCPDRPGAWPDGCPGDGDRDGILDDMDACPGVPGVAQYRGCPPPAPAAAPRGASILVAFRDPRTGLYGYVDRGTNAIVIPAQYDSAEDFTEGLGLVGPTHAGCATIGRSPDRCGYGFIDASNRWVLLPDYSAARPFSEGLAAAIPLANSQAGYGFIDRSGSWVIAQQFADCGVDHRLCIFQGGRARVRLMSQAASEYVIDRSGHVVP